MLLHGIRPELNKQVLIAIDYVFLVESPLHMLWITPITLKIVPIIHAIWAVWAYIIPKLYWHNCMCSPVLSIPNTKIAIHGEVFILHMGGSKSVTN